MLETTIFCFGYKVCLIPKICRQTHHSCADSVSNINAMPFQNQVFRECSSQKRRLQFLWFRTLERRGSSSKHFRTWHR